MESIWQRLSWPQVVALGLVVAGVVAVLAVVPTEKIVDLPWEQLVGLASVLVGGGIGAFSDRLVRPRSPASIPPASAPDVRERRTESPPPPRREGMTHPETLAWILLWALGAGLALSRALAHLSGVLLVVVAAASLSGCGASALRVHAGVASTLGATLDQACEEIETGRARALDGCAGEPDADADAACLARERARYAEAVGGCGATKVVHDAWADEIVDGASRDTWTWEDGLPLVVRMLDVATRLVPHLDALGVHIDLGPLAALAARGAP